MKRKPIFSILSIVLCINCEFAGAVEPITPAVDTAWIASLSLGPALGNGGKTQTFFLTEELEKTYVANQSNKILLNGELLLGIQKTLSQYVFSQFGLALLLSSPASLSGVIWDDALPQFDNHIYSYKIQHNHVAIKAKFLGGMDYCLLPWLSASLGLGFNSAYSYQNTPIIFEALPNPNFASHTQISVTYTLGAGLQKIVSPHWQLGAGYEFSDWGKNHLGQAAEQTVNNGISLGHFYTNAFVINLTYIC